ncbi:MAG: hypothetical protein ACRETG_04330 [Steroidobacteraceae bacterium]
MRVARVACRSFACALCSICAAVAAAAGHDHEHAQADRVPVPTSEGIWKAAVPPPGTMHGEFGNDDPIGLAAGVRIEADCSINWVDPDSGRLYCFSTATSLVVFLDRPHAYLERARAQWLRLGGSTR